MSFIYGIYILVLPPPCCIHNPETCRIVPNSTLKTCHPIVPNSTLKTCHPRYEQVGDDDVDEPGGCILAHIMGLGKTLTTIAFLQTYLSTPAADGRPRRVLVVVPPNVLFNFFYEFHHWLPPTTSPSAPPGEGEAAGSSNLTREKVRVDQARLRLYNSLLPSKHHLVHFFSPAALCKTPVPQQATSLSKVSFFPPSPPRPRSS